MGMIEINFPKNTEINYKFSVKNKVWKNNGLKWRLIPFETPNSGSLDGGNSLSSNIIVINGGISNSTFTNDGINSIQ
jgi:hypothetical protein